VNPLDPPDPPSPTPGEKPWRERRHVVVVMAAVTALLVATAAHAAGGGGAAGCAAAIGAVVGLGAAALCRVGKAAALAMLPALGLALLWRGCGGAVAAASMALAGLALAATALGLARSAFDGRLERLRDMGWLLAGAAVTATATGIGLALWLARLPASADLHAAPPWTLLAWLSLAGMLLTALPALTMRSAERGPEGRSVVLQALLAAVVMGALAAPWQSLQADPQPLWWGLPVVALLALWAVGGTALSSTVLAAMALGLGLSSAAAAPALQAQSLALVLVMQGLLLVAHAQRAEASWREQRWEWALDGSRLGVADWRLQGRESFVSAAWRTLAGTPAAPWSPEAWAEAVHPDDRADLRAALVRCPGRGRAAAAGAAHADGRRLALAGSHAAGHRARCRRHPCAPAGHDADVDERHDAQERQRLSVSLFQHLHEGLLITDAELRVLDANPAYTQILGVTRAEMLGTRAVAAAPTPADPLARQQRAAMWAALRSRVAGAANCSSGGAAVRSAPCRSRSRRSGPRATCATTCW
jgi:PAS domain-containing protein